MLIPEKLRQVVYSFIMLFKSKKMEIPPFRENNPITSIYEIQVRNIDGETVTLAEYKGRKMLIVNVASECGYTPQYARLQSLYQRYINKLVVLGFPSNDFGEQEPGSNAEIKMFCKEKYNVQFPIFEKSSVINPGINPVFGWLTDKKQNGWNNVAPKWNFYKYLVDENGKLISYYSKSVNPLDDDILSKLNSD